MITSSEMYWLTRFDKIHDINGMFLTAIFITMIALAVIAVIILFVSSDEDEKDQKKMQALSWRMMKFAAVLIIPLILLVSVRIFVPTTNEMAAIKVVPMLANNTVKKDAGELYGLTMSWLKAQMGEVTTQVKEQVKEQISEVVEE